MISKEIKGRILSAIELNRSNYPSDAKHASALGISASVYHQLKKGQLEKALSDANWVRIARRLDVSLRDSIEWKGARTETFKYVTTQLEVCQERSLSVILCDVPNIGKTFTARWYVNEHRNAVYIDCSQVKTKRAMVRKIANEFGLDGGVKYQDVYEDLVYYLRSMERPLVVLDEAGDLQYEAFLELKALWNATEMCCGWYMMGADGLAAKIKRNVEGRKVGYAEIFSRYGGKYSRVTPEQEDDRREFLLEQARVVARVNAPDGSDIGQIVRKSGGGLRRVYTEIEKIKRGL
ncbi:ATP-binding protein [Prevotella sp. P3-122]|uniref:ATP-binding protein n=1 Tax=Prevotella sp. P3-122 TaxID=2024223 RepID=UPI000B96B287|nr:ATP-binding protein [Prevotella sp. P3-122]OYP59421.1 AAA family ATPase [Prevotella sp. P3-122]